MLPLFYVKFGVYAHFFDFSSVLGACNSQHSFSDSAWECFRGGCATQLQEAQPPTLHF